MTYTIDKNSDEITISIWTDFDATMIDNKILVRKECGKTLVEIFTYDKEKDEYLLIDENYII